MTTGFPRGTACKTCLRGAAVAAPAFEYPFQNPDPLAAEERITDLIARMTLEEKIACLGMRTAVPRLDVKGSPHIGGYHGVA